MVPTAAISCGYHLSTIERLDVWYLTPKISINLYLTYDKGETNRSKGTIPDYFYKRINEKQKKDVMTEYYKVNLEYLR